MFIICLGVLLFAATGLNGQKYGVKFVDKEVGRFDDPTIGGFSGMTYVPGEDAIYVVSDTGSPDPLKPYLYKFRVPLKRTGFEPPWDFLGRFEIKGLDGASFIDSFGSYNGEGLAYDMGSGKFFLVNERGTKNGNEIHQIDNMGNLLGSYQVPETHRFGGKENRGFQGVTVAPRVDFPGRLFVGMEGPLTQDSGEPNNFKGAPVSILMYDLAQNGGSPTAEYRYNLDPVPAGFAEGGLAAMEAINENQFMVLEQYWTDDFLKFAAKIFVVTLEPDTTNVMNMRNSEGALPVGARVKALKKSLLTEINENTIGGPVDRLDRMSFYRFDDDKESMAVLVGSDNDFQNSPRFAQIIAYEFFQVAQ